MRSPLYWLPVLLTLVTAVCFTTSYIFAVVRGDVSPFWPYISDTGAKPPESCIFGQLLNFTACLAMFTMYVRYKLVQAFNNHDSKLRCLNNTALFFGALSSIGVSLVANFQEDNVIAVHVTGAFMAFGLGIVYCFLHSAITRRMYPMYNGYYIWVLRFIISFIGLVALVNTSIFAMISQQQAGKFKNSTDYPLHWKPSDPGYDLHVVSTTNEWIIGITFLSFFLTYTKDFQKISMRILPELLVSHLDETPIVFTNSSSPTERTGLLA